MPPGGLAYVTHCSKMVKLRPSIADSGGRCMASGPTARLAEQGCASTEALH